MAKKNNIMAKVLALVVLAFFTPLTVADEMGNPDHIGELIEAIHVIEQADVNDELDREFVMNLNKKNKTVFCLAQNAFYEARGESLRNKIAVSQVVQNRVDADGYPDSHCGVIRQVTVNKTTNKRVCQFSWYCDRAKSNSIPVPANARPQHYKEWYDSVKAAMLVYTNKVKNVAEGATHFYAQRQVKPVWAKQMKVVEVIGNHTFVKPRE